jgi:hypothetical protein
MSGRKLSLYLIIGLTLLSCSASRPAPSGYGDPSARMFNSGFSVVPPQEKGWLIMDRDAYRLVLVKQGANRDESYAAVASLVLLPADLDNREIFFEHIRKARSKALESEGFRVLSNRDFLFDEKGEYCVRYRSETEEMNGSKDAGAEAPLIHETIGFYCRHPDETNVAVNAEYAYRHRVVDADPELETKADRFLKAVNFESLTAY